MTGRRKRPASRGARNQLFLRIVVVVVVLFIVLAMVGAALGSK